MSWLAFVVVVVLILGLVVWLIHKGRREYRDEAKILAQISSVSVDEAEQRALAILGDERLFHCVKSVLSEEQGLEPLPVTVKRLFQRYESIESLVGPKVRLDRKSIRSARNRPGFIAIGRGMEATDVEFEIGVLPSEEKVYEIYPNEVPDPVFGTYNTIYHLVLAVAEESKGRS